MQEVRQQEGTTTTCQMPDCRSLATAAAAAAAKLRRVLDAAEAADPEQLDERPETVIGQVTYCMHILYVCAAWAGCFLIYLRIPKISALYAS